MNPLPLRKHESPPGLQGTERGDDLTERMGY